MSKLSLDMSQFKHLKSDKKSTTLQHAKLGHTITLDHASLSKQDLSALDKMPKDYMDAADKSEMKGESRNMARGGKAKKFADGGEVDDTPVPQGLDPQAPAATLDTATQPDLSADMSNFNDPTVIQKHQQIAQALQMDPENFRRGLQMAMAGTLGPEGVEMEEADTAAKALNQAENKGYGKTAIVEKAPKPWEPGGKSNWTPGNDGVGVQIRQNVPKFADGGDVEPVDPNSLYTTDPEAAAPVLNQAYQTGQQNAIKAQMQANALPTDTPDLSGIFGDQDPEMKATQQVYQRQEAERADAEAQKAAEDQRNAKLHSMRAQLGLEPIPETNPGQPTPDAPQPKNAQPMAQNNEGQPPDIEAGVMGGFNNQMQGIQQEAAAKGALGQVQAQAIQKSIDARTEAMSAYQKHYDALEQERQAHIQDVQDGYIDPNKYWTGDANGNGSHSKMLAGIGMILAGFNPTTNPNAAVNFLKYQMDQNLEAQKQNLGAKQNLLTANLHQFGNLKDATDMTRIMQNDLVSNELSAAAAKAQTPMAKAQAMQAVGQLQRESAMMQQQFAMRRAMINLASSPNQNPQSVSQMIGYMRVTNPEAAKEMESRYIPNVGLAQTPVPDGTRQQIIAKQQLNDALGDLRQWSASHSGSLSPSDIATGRTKAANVQNLYREGINGGVFKKGEQEFIDNIVDSEPTKFFNTIRVLPKLDEVARGNQASLNTLKKGYGLPVSQPNQAPRFKTVNGVKMMRGPNGEAIKVK